MNGKISSLPLHSLSFSFFFPLSSSLSLSLSFSLSVKNVKRNSDRFRLSAQKDSKSVSFLSPLTLSLPLSHSDFCLFFFKRFTRDELTEILPQLDVSMPLESANGKSLSKAKAIDALLHSAFVSGDILSLEISRNLEISLSLSLNLYLSLSLSLSLLKSL
jgi:hypothetical protein